MDTDRIVLSFTEGIVDNKYIDSSNLDNPIKTNSNIPGKFKHEIGSREIEELKPKTYSFENYPAKENGIKNKNNDKHEDYYNELMDNRERSVEE